MNIGINAFVSNNFAFRSNFLRKSARNIGMSVVAASTLLTAACGNNRQDPELSKRDSIQLEDSFDAPAERIVYYYLPPEDGKFDAQKYAWVDRVKPDGSIVRDSSDYKILVSSEGERTVIHTTTDESGNQTTTTEYSDGSKLVKTDYCMKNPEEILYTEKLYNKDSVLIENKYYNEYFNDSVPTKKEIEQSYEKYNDKGVLLYWTSNVKDPERNAGYNKYDNKGRLIYDDVKNEHYEYKGSNKTPSSSYSVYEECKRVTLYNEDNKVKKIYFEASDGTETEASWLLENGN